MRIFFPLFLLFFLIACNNHSSNSQEQQPLSSDLLKETIAESDVLISISNDEETSFAFVNNAGDTIIPFGKYSQCWTDTLRNYAIVFGEKSTGSKVVAIDRKENILFDIYLFDNGPDQAVDGLFRVKKANKIGFANETGKIVIPCIYECAFPFEQGRAKVALTCVETNHEGEHSHSESNQWIYIDKIGNEIK
jgi:hypothetical protein